MTVTEDELAARRAQAPLAEAPPAEPEAEQQPEPVEPTPPDADGQGEDEETPEEPKPPKLLQEPLPGLEATISHAFGGAEPDRSEIRLLGGKMPLEGSYPKGTEIDLLVRVRITGVLGQDLEDAYGTRGGTVRRHMARMVAVRRVPK